MTQWCGWVTSCFAASILRLVESFSETSCLDAQSAECAAVEHDRCHLGVHRHLPDPQDHDDVVTGRDQLLDRAFQPQPGALDEYRTGLTGYSIQAGEPVASLGGECLGRLVVGLAEHADAQFRQVIK